MGLFSVYCGVIYNDFTSIPMEAFGPSCFNLSNKSLPTKVDCVYKVGVDPAWYMAYNELEYINSLKMKMAVILGVGQMTMGVVLKGVNYLHTHKLVDFIFEFIPQIVLLLALFGFMDLLIIIKWLTDFSLPVEDPEQAKLSPPSIISSIILMGLGFGEQTNPLLRERDLIPN